MIFLNQKIFNLINQINKTAKPLFDVKYFDSFFYVSKPNKKVRQQNNHYIKILMRLTFLVDELDKFGEIYIHDNYAQINEGAD